MLLVPYTAWAQVVFVLFDAGERVALTPFAEALKEQGKEVRIIDIDPKGRDRYASFDGEWDGLDPDVNALAVAEYLFCRGFYPDNEDLLHVALRGLSKLIFLCAKNA